MTPTIDHIKSLVEPLLEGTDMFVTQVLIKPTNNVKVYVDADAGFAIENSAIINRKLYHLIETQQIFGEEDFSLEVSSPGIEEPLLQVRQYIKNIGRELEVTLHAHDTPAILGKLVAANEEKITLEIKKPKSKETTERSIPMEDIKSAIVQISFK